MGDHADQLVFDSGPIVLVEQGSHTIKPRGLRCPNAVDRLVNLGFFRDIAKQ